MTRLLKFANRVATDARPDRALLEALAAGRDADALAELFRRHAAAVRRAAADVCPAAADEVVQAAFLLLADRAGTLAGRASAAGWLFHTARRLALKARTAAARRSRHEARVPPPPAPAPVLDDLAFREVRALVAEELDRLPEQLREPLVLHYWEGATHAGAAARLGCSVSTLKRLLDAGREHLGARLARRGLTGAGVLAALAAIQARAAAGPPPGACPVASAAAGSACVAAWGRGAGGLGVAKGLAAVACVLAAGAALAICVAASGPAPHPTVVPANPAPAPGPKAARPPIPDGPNVLVLSRSGDLVRIDPDGKNEKKLATGERLNLLTNNARLSPDGKRLAFLRTFVEGPTSVTKLFVRESGDKGPVTDLGVECTHIAWSADGIQIAGSNVREGANGSADATHLVVNVTTKETASLDLPRGHFITDWSRDGKHFLTTSMNLAADPPTSEIHWWTRDGKEHKTLAGSKREAALYGQFSPDGTRVLYAWYAVTGGAGDFAPGKLRMAVLDLTTGKASPVAGMPAGEIRRHCWSPDGKRIAYTWREVHAGKQEDLKTKMTLSHLVVCEPDGRNAKTIASATGPNPTADTIVEVTWR